MTTNADQSYTTWGDILDRAPVNDRYSNGAVVTTDHNLISALASGGAIKMEQDYDGVFCGRWILSTQPDWESASGRQGSLCISIRTTTIDLEEEGFPSATAIGVIAPRTGGNATYTPFRSLLDVPRLSQDWRNVELPQANHPTSAGGSHGILMCPNEEEDGITFDIRLIEPSTGQSFETSASLQMQSMAPAAPARTQVAQAPLVSASIVFRTQ